MNDVKSKLNEIIRAYLVHEEFKATDEAFRTECKKLGQSCMKEEEEQARIDVEKKAKYREELLNHFDGGNKDEFFKKWESVIPSSADNQKQEYLQLECHLHLHFAVFAANRAKGSEDEVAVKEKIDEGMHTFKEYLESRGSVLSKETDFLPYFALPFIENPTQHLSFAELFEESWVQRVRGELETFLNKIMGATAKNESVDLISMYERHLNYDRLEQLLESSQQQLQSKNKDLAKLQVKIFRHLECNMASSTFSNFLIDFFNELITFDRSKVNYQNLMRVTVELLSALEVMVKGEDVNLTNVIDVCLTAFPDLFPSYAERGKAYDRISIESETAALSDKSLSDQNHNYEIFKPKVYDWALVTLDYKEIRQDLVSGPLRLKIFLLQAIRWRLTRSPPGAQRRAVLYDYIVNDLLGQQGGIYNSSISQLVVSPISDLRQTMFRLLNSFASLSIGRSYLAQKSGILSAIMDSVLYNKLEQISLDMALAALQKLSLRRELQTAMIQRDIIEKLILLLGDGDALSDYALEYAVALLMNLSLRSVGKQRCAKQPQQVLKVLTNLLGSQNHDIIPYVNGTLYSLLTNPGIRREALNMGLEDMLNCFMQESSLEIKRQLEFILKQLTSENPVENTISDFEDEDDDDEENDVMEEELDQDDSVAIVPGEMQGELLLSTYYSTHSTKTNSKKSESLQSETPKSLDRKPVGSPQKWSQQTLTETDSLEESLSSAVWYPNQLTSLDTATVDSSPKSPLLDHYATHVVTKVIGVEKPVSEAAEFPPVMPKEPEKHGKSVNEYIVAFSSRPKIPRTPEHSPNYRSGRAIR